MKQLREFLTFKNAFIVALVIAILILSTCQGKETVEKIVKVPEYVILTDTIKVTPTEEKEIKVKDGTAVVGKKIFEEYEAEKDTVKKKEIFTEAVKIRDYREVLLDNDTAKVTVNSKVQGFLIYQNAEIVVKERKIPIQVNKNPRLSLVLGTDLTYMNMEFNPMINAGIQTRNGNTYKVGLGLNKSVTIGFSKTFTIIK